MAMTDSPALPTQAPVVELHGHARHWAVAATGLGLLMTVLTIVWNILTPWGQELDQRAYSAIATTDGFRWQHLDTVLAVVDTNVLGVAFGLCFVVALVRRRLDLGVAAFVVVLGANVSQYLLRTHLVHRPDHGVWQLGADNSAPSGHATAAASLAVAIVLVTPMTVRFVVTFVASLWATWVSLGVIVSRMGNRPGDVIAALAVVTAWAGVGLAVAAVLAGRPRQRRALVAFRRQVRGFVRQHTREHVVAGAPYGLGLLLLAGLSAVVVMGVLLVSWGVGVEATPVGLPLGLGTLALVGSLAGLLVGATSRAVEKYLR
ncbi:hypothetical protein [Arsenicicoccus dermatophilus]|uniref:hypothetical protein n=1 Tax=Arsenicicoccus dermatophilus TaxID=1076331 RepID=UPI001F4CE512|nr:hypothetical protein [Arsenicicoccus dermatophilus]MCH8612204.1 hypothetical protein [Arsenicicoccus dermatophilus]